MTEATMRAILAEANEAAETLAVGLGQLDFLESRITGTDAVALRSARRSVESAAVRLRSTRSILRDEMRKEGVFVADHAGEDAKGSRVESHAPGSGE
jgi:hypothetical protein